MTQGAKNSSLFPAGLKSSRRGFLAGAAGLGVGAALLPSLGRAADTTEPKKGGSLKVAMGHGAATDTLDPGALVNAYQVVLSFALTDTLTEVAADGSLAPAVAESWEASQGAAVWTFKLRKDITFHDGRPLKAKDVVAALNHHRGQKSESAVKPVVKAVTAVEAPDDHTVVVTLEDGNADFPYNISIAAFGIYPAKEDGSLDWQSGIGLGGYVLEHYDPGVSAKLRRNPNYWKAGRAHVEEVELLSIHDTSARTNALLTGAVDVISDVDPKTASLLARRSGVVVEETAGPLHYTFPMITTQAPFDNNDVRLALKYAIDREEILDKVLRGHGTIGNDNPIGPSYRYFAAEVAPRPYDPDKARFHLKKAGQDGLTLDLSAADAAFSGAVDAAVLYREQAAKAGITLNVVREPNDGYWSNVWMKKPFCACYWGGYSTEDAMFTTGYAEDASWNDTFWKHERFNKLLKEARPLLDEAKRREIYTEMQMIVRDEGGVVAPIFANALFARRDTVDHGPLANNAGLDGRRVVERWWRA